MIFFKNSNFGNYPIFFSNACAISYVLKKANNGGFFNTYKCSNDIKCPLEQRKICENFYLQQKLNKQEIAKFLNNFFKKNVNFNIVNNTTISLNEEISFSEIVFLQNVLHCEILVKNTKNDYWGSSICGSKIIEF